MCIEVGVIQGGSITNLLCADVHVGGNYTKNHTCIITNILHPKTLDTLGYFSSSAKSITVRHAWKINQGKIVTILGRYLKFDLFVGVDLFSGSNLVSNLLDPSSYIRDRYRLHRMICGTLDCDDRLINVLFFELHHQS